MGQNLSDETLSRRKISGFTSIYIGYLCKIFHLLCSMGYVTTYNLEKMDITERKCV